MLPSPIGRQHTGAEEDDGKIFPFPDHLLRGHTSGSDRVSNPAWRPLPHQWWGIKERRGKSQTGESTWKRCFYVHLLHGKKGANVYSMKMYVSQKIYPHEPVCSKGVIIQELPSGSNKIGMGVGKRATKGEEVIMWHFFSSFRSLGT